MKKNLVKGAIIYVLIVAIAFTLCIETTQTSKRISTPSELLDISKQTVRSIDKLQAFGYSKKIENCYVNYTFRIDKIKSKTILKFENVDYDCKSIVYKRLQKALNNAILIDVGEEYYLYTPSITEVKDFIVKYKSQNLILKYRGLPIIPCLNVINTFDKAKNIELICDKGGIKIVTYDYEDPYIGYTKITVWIDENNIPIKSVFNFPQYNVTIVSEIVNYTIGKAEDFNLSAYEIVER